MLVLTHSYHFELQSALGKVEKYRTRELKKERKWSDLARNFVKEEKAA